METFTDRFNRLTVGIDQVDLMKATGLSPGAVADLKTGRTKSIKLRQALKLCKLLRITPWELQGEREPLPPQVVGKPTAVKQLAIADHLEDTLVDEQMVDLLLEASLNSVQAIVLIAKVIELHVPACAEALSPLQSGLIKQVNLLLSAQASRE